jgi:hypothetical protein
VLTCGLLLWSLLSPLERLAKYQGEIEPVNPAARDFVIQLQAIRRPGEIILIDSRLDESTSNDPSTRTMLARLLNMLGIPEQDVELTRLRTADATAAGQSALLVTSNARHVEGIARSRPLALPRGPSVPLKRLRVYRVSLSALP